MYDDLVTVAETQLLALLRGPKMSDKQISATLGLTQGEAIALFHGLRVKLGVDGTRESLRDFVKRHSA